MDYGKLAYMKAEELESRLTATSASPKFRSSYQSVTPSVDFASGQELYLTQVSASGVAALIIKLSCSVFEAGTIELLLGGLKLGHTTFNTLNGSECEGIVVGQALVEGSQSLSIRASEGFVGRIKCISVLSYGNSVSVDTVLSGLSVDGRNDSFLGLLPVNNTIYYAKGSTGHELCTSSRTLLGRGDKSDLIYIEGADGQSSGLGFRAVYADNYDNVWGIVFDSDFSINSRVYLGYHMGLTSVKLTSYEGRLVLVYLIGGKLYLSLCNEDFLGQTSLFETSTHVRVERVGFLKDKGVLTMYFCGEGKSFVKTLESESKGNEHIKIQMSVTVTEV